MLGSLAATMPEALSSRPDPRLTLTSQLDDLARVLPWLEVLANRYAVPPQTRFAIQLCLEEALSNIVRHGYRGRAHQSITVECAPPAAGELVFTIEDHAPPFDPLATPASDLAPAPQSIADLQPGDQGLRLMRNFASRLAWEPTPNGNRLTLAFNLPR